MTDHPTETDAQLERWLIAERWFIRYIGGAIAIIGIISLFSGTLNNPEGGLLISVFNVVIAITLLIGGLWTIRASYDEEQMAAMMDGFLEQPANRPIVFAVVQIVTGLLLLLDGFNGRPVMLLLGILLLTSAGWFLRRSMQIRRFQT